MHFKRGLQVQPPVGCFNKPYQEDQQMKENSIHESHHPCHFIRQNEAALQEREGMGREEERSVPFVPEVEHVEDVGHPKRPPSV